MYCVQASRQSLANKLMLPLPAWSFEKLEPDSIATSLCGGALVVHPRDV